ncbi:MAG: hypothetical protein JEY94_07560 [Melioribacteraceae bacterium]|nr:hypothetical protein [Melioribacteraceae bacterium]
MNKNYRKQPILILTFTMLILFSLSFLPDELEVFGVSIKHVDIISDLKSDPEEEYYEDDNSGEDTLDIDEDDSEEPIEAGITILNDALELSSDFVKHESDKIENYLSSNLQFKTLPLKGNTAQMKYFYDALKKSKSEKIRIAHYGDSAIEGDNITSEIRKNMQKKFGGKGVGFLAITSQDIRFRPTTEHTFSNDWESASIFTRNSKKLPVGINGEVFIPKVKSWVEYYATGTYSSIRNFKEARLFYSDGAGSELTYTFDEKSSNSEKLTGRNKITELTLDSKRSSRRVKIEFNKVKDVKLYGMSLEGGNGVYVDNFPLRGNSGVSMQNIPVGNLKEFSKMLNYKLIILYFGLNVVSDKKMKLGWYEKEMIKVIQQLKEAFPKTSILVVSVSDKSVKKGSRFVTNAMVPKLVKTQEKIAEETNVAFWNLYEAMGGKNAMHNWVKSTPPLATKDYTHFTLKGSIKVGEMLSEVLLNGAGK